MSRIRLPASRGDRAPPKSAGRSSPSARCMRALSRRSSTEPPAVSPACATSRTTPPTPCCCAAAAKQWSCPPLDRDGDCLSDLVLQMYGSIAGAESMILAFELATAKRTRRSRRRPPDCARPWKGRTSPIQCILGGSSVRPFAGAAPRRAAISEAAFEAVCQEVRRPRPRRAVEHDRLHPTRSSDT